MYQPIRLLLFSMAFMGLFLTSCQKNEDVSKTQISREQANKMVEDQRAKDVKKIRHFLDKMTDVMSESSVTNREEPLTIEEMTFGTEAVLNIYYTKPDNRFTEVDKSQASVVVPISNGKVSDVDLLAAYNAVGQKAMDHLAATSYPNKKLVYVDVTISNKTATVATLDVKTAVGEKRGAESVLAPYFSNGWRCGAGVYNDAGLEQVGDIGYAMPTFDAANLFQSTLNAHYRLDHPLPTSNYSWYTYDATILANFLLVDGSDFGFPQENENDLVSGDNSKDYKTYKIVKSANSNYDDKKYINSEEMNFYYSGLEDFILLMEDPVWQANHASCFSGLDDPGTSNSTFVGYKLLNVESITAVEFPFDISDKKTIHIPKINMQKAFMWWPDVWTGDGNPQEAIEAIGDQFP